MTTITIEVDDKLLDNVQNYALSQKTSLSLLVENYFKLLTQENNKLVLLKLLTLGNREIEQGAFRDAEMFFAELDQADV